ncbi:alpha,alpha-trehalase TreF [Muricauda sp. JGD-17]|uniref:Alpha,alpha-trehalase TreF n=1 Tax=Flagellimonas ochracea TaxID=2696472 RepID=A0A964TCF8_9FLAO|nr:alpha,alpha-trehalase TreF [Allomuricauda ochracea]NAY90946.1 alpha,alpha-trehalase TreF [Allomuricauda ochracea]
MKKLVLGLLLCSIVLGSCRQTPQTVEQISLYDSQLFKDVQLSAVFEDSKTFVDLVPTEEIAILEAKYLAEKDEPEFDLKSFVQQHFQDRSMKAQAFETDTTKTMYEHISSMWDKLTRGPDSLVPNSSRIPLPYEYVVPGGRFQEIYYWDSYFTMEGLLADGRDDLAKNMVDNFSFLIDSLGFIPNGTRDYYNTRSQPPFYPLMVDALARQDENMLLYYLPQLAKEYDFWMEGSETVVEARPQRHVVDLGKNVYLNRYWDQADTPRPEAYKEDIHLASDLEKDSLQKLLFRNLRSAAASGWDFSSRWYGEKGEFNSTETTSILPIDLNCLLYFMERTLYRASTLKADEDARTFFYRKAQLRKSAIRYYFWNGETGFFQDYNFKKGKTTGELSLAGVYPLYFEIATEEQAESVKNVLMESFLKKGGLTTTLEHSGQQWDAPNGWAPLQWMAVKGLLKYGYEQESIEIMERWLSLNERVYANTGKMMEKYNVEDLSLLSGGGEYPTQDGFGWTNGVALGFKKMLDELKK